jgi:putative GTP pyrophosphokinase
MSFRHVGMLTYMDLGKGEKIIMGDDQANSFPGGSKKRVALAGDNVRNNIATPDDLSVIDTWRAAHRAVLNTFQAILRTRTRYKGIVVAQRHKRKITIFDKLKRFPGMNLARMDDVAGCRLIFNSVDELYSFRDEFHKANFKHKLKNSVEKYDYIKHPKATEYRGIHDIYEYNVNSKSGKQYKGLLVEIQYRTAVQHAWATCVEVIGFITESQPKFQRGDERYERAMLLASEIIARTAEGMSSCIPNLPSEELFSQFQILDSELNLMSMLRGLRSVKSTFSLKRNAILIISKDSKLEIKTYRDAPSALRALFELERDNPGKDVVLVKADTSEEVRTAFKNYFSDANEFIRLISEGCKES